MIPSHINPIQWNQSVGYARQAAARIFRDGGTPADAMRAFGIEPYGSGEADWSKAVAAIAEMLCTPGAAEIRRAA
jgi:hypothetical protein